jgi:hypothetical protein
MGSILARISTQAKRGGAMSNATYLRLIDEAVQSICPSALSLRLSRIDTESRHIYPSIYDADKMMFRVKRCRAFIRKARCGEFDYTPDDIVSETFQHRIGFQNPLLPNDALKSVKQFIPALWVAVFDLGNGSHHVATMYRGDAFFSVRDFEGQTIADVNAEELDAIIARMQERNGIDEASWKRYCEKLHESCEKWAIASNATTRMIQ